MIKAIPIIIAWLLFWSTPFLQANRVANNPPPGGGGETLWAETTTDTGNDWWQIFSTFEYNQSVDVTGTSGSVSKVRILAYLGAAAPPGRTIHIEIWDSNDTGAGSQIGGDSDAVVVTQTSETTYVDFTWSSDLPDMTGETTVYIHPIHDNTGDGASRWRLSTTDVYAGGAAYDDSGTLGSGDQDFIFELYVQ
jgi:hypothetical protein